MKSYFFCYPCSDPLKTTEKLTLMGVSISVFSADLWFLPLTFMTLLYPVVVERDRKKSKSDEGTTENHTQKTWFLNRPFLRIMLSIHINLFTGMPFLGDFDRIALMPALPAAHSYLLFTSLLLCLATRIKQSEPC